MVEYGLFSGDLTTFLVSLWWFKGILEDYGIELAKLYQWQRLNMGSGDVMASSGIELPLMGYVDLQ